MLLLLLLRVISVSNVRSRQHHARCLRDKQLLFREIRHHPGKLLQHLATLPQVSFRPSYEQRFIFVFIRRKR